MLTMHPTLLVGPADWNPARLPKEEFDARIAAFWRACDPGIAGVVVFGSPRHHAELAYLTHFTPKLEGAIALIPRQGVPCLLAGGGANMLEAAKPLTWVNAVVPLRDAGTTIARWQDENGYPKTGFLTTTQHQALLSEGAAVETGKSGHRRRGGHAHYARHARGIGGPFRVIGGLVGRLFRR